MFKISQQIAEQLAEKFLTDEFVNTMEKAVKASDSGEFEVVITTENVDRMGEVILSSGWDFSHYMKNPVVLWGHSHSTPPVAVTTDLRQEDTKTIAKGKFATSEFGQVLRKLYDDGMLRATSVGFIEKEREGNLITKAELIEWSFVSVPANPFALSSLSKLGFSIDDMITKGILDITVKDNEEVADEVTPTVTPTDEVTPDAPQTEENGDEVTPKADEVTPTDEEVTPKEDEVAPKDEVAEPEDVKSLLLDIKKLLIALEGGPVKAQLERKEGDSNEDEEKTPEEKSFELFVAGRSYMQLASSALSESLAEARKAVKDKIGN